MADPTPSRPDPGRDEGGSWLFAVLFMVVAISAAVWGCWLFWEALA